MAKKHDSNEEPEQQAPVAGASYTLIRSGAFGYGTRPKGFVFAIEDGDAFVPSKGVSETEVAEILNNPEFFEIR